MILASSLSAALPYFRDDGWTHGTRGLSMMDRRTVLKIMQAAAVTGAAWPLLREKRARAAAPAHRSRPRFYLQIIPSGGMDAIFTTDPKKAREVDNGIDVPFGSHKIIEAHGVRLGPKFGALGRWVPHVAMVNAFHQNSANHVTGVANITRFKSLTTPGTPSLLELLGARRDDEATGAINIGCVFDSAFSPMYLGQPGTFVFGNRPGLFEHLDAADPEDLVAVAKALQRDAGSVQGPRASAAEQRTADNLNESASLFSGAAKSPKFKPVEWAHEVESAYHSGRDLQRALWLFENKLTRCVTTRVAADDFDTHVTNSYQETLTDYLAFLLDKLFSELDKRVVDGKPLSQQTVVIVGSEIGRFPRLNSARGKDHFPQAPFIFYGPWFATGATYGGTGRNMATVPISMTTGRPQSGGHLLRVDDIGTTLLALDGANPELYGYSGEHLRFLT